MDNIEIVCEAIQHADGKIEIFEDGVNVGGIWRSTEVALAYLKCRREVARLKRLIDSHASWMHGLTPDQADELSCADLRSTAQELRALAQINT